jgi:hypothetical protein
MTALCPQDQGFAAALPRLALLANDQQNYRDDRQQKDVASAVHVGEESIELGHCDAPVGDLFVTKPWCCGDQFRAKSWLQRRY